LKSDNDFTWGAKQQEAFDKIKLCLSTPMVMKASKHGEPFKGGVIGVVLAQETEGKEHVITYLSWRLPDTETRYTFIEKLCLCLYYACTKL
jgi:hypothetical protein